MTKWKKFDLRKFDGGCFSKWARPTPNLNTQTHTRGHVNSFAYVSISPFSGSFASRVGYGRFRYRFPSTQITLGPTWPLLYKLTKKTNTVQLGRRFADFYTVMGQLRPRKTTETGPLLDERFNVEDELSEKG